MINNLSLSPKSTWLIWCVEVDGEYTAYGSRKLNRVDLQVDYQMDRFNTFGGYAVSGGFSGPPTYDLTASLNGFIVTHGKTEIEAVFNLLTAFKDEELQETKQKLAIAAETLRKKEEKKRHKKGRCIANCGLCAQEELAALRKAHDDLVCEDDCDYCLEDEYGCECCR